MIFLAESSAAGSGERAVRLASSKETAMQDQPARSTWSADDFDGVVSQLLDEFAAADFRSAERVLDRLRQQGRTISGYPRIRPSDCDRVIRAIRAAFEA